MEKDKRCSTTRSGARQITDRRGPSWEAPASVARRWTGLARSASLRLPVGYAQLMNSFADTVGIGAVTAQGGEARAELRVEDRHLNPAGTVHGGVMATLVDTAMGAAVHSMTGDNDTAATTQLTIAYLRAGRNGLLRVRARVGKQGEHVLVCEAQIEQDGQALIEALATFAVTDQ